MHTFLAHSYTHTHKDSMAEGNCCHGYAVNGNCKFIKNPVELQLRRLVWQIYYDLNATFSQVCVCVCVCYSPVVTVRQKNEDSQTGRKTERMRQRERQFCVGVDAQCWQLPSCRLCDNTLLNTVYTIFKRIRMCLCIFIFINLP